MELPVPRMNEFCRRFDLIYVETGRQGGQDVYWFIDFENNRRYYTIEEIRSKMGMQYA